MTFERARNNYELETDIETSRNIISELKREIKSLGDVMLGSIEVYERVNKRYSFLTRHMNDLKAREQN